MRSEGIPGALLVEWEGGTHGRVELDGLDGTILRGSCDAALSAQLCAAPPYRRVASTPVEVAVPPSWSLTARPNGFHFRVGEEEIRLTVYPDATEAGEFEALPRDGTEHEEVLPTGALYYRRQTADHTSVFVKVRLAGDRSWVCSTNPHYESVCRSLRAVSR
ncbi:MAG: hypothetical protein AB8I08_31930 [Sandaracinaceae bacterium]